MIVAFSSERLLIRLWSLRVEYTPNLLTRPRVLGRTGARYFRLQLVGKRGFNTGRAVGARGLQAWRSKYQHRLCVWRRGGKHPYTVDHLRSKRCGSRR